MRIFIHSIVAISLLTGCEATSQITKAPPTEVAKVAPTEAQMIAAKPGEPLSPVNADGSSKSPFPKGFVVRLNAIMARSKTVIDRFDVLRPAIEKAGKASTAELTELKSLHSESIAAKADLAKEGTALIETGQYYDTAIFSGMAIFADKVEKELADEIKLLSAAK